ncbi:acetyl-CoA hydrolase/transferase C-terminal domain-containing protein [Mesorhizobium sp. LHD-90]|uniref:acetyl-CoA hydrolase/transferase family protein n=1 Tax=Mesorhizobium sp. LHD-90 TaxID=3071414 RepID=UPI0027DFC919|nr:acetyl-CoA hydrolase/transferase C-terminal domain-containing protein [Mesorhizobium sp. LHD-90]MDQ6433206.1 acetyl-CoA hydrolase/transferase C-terminal domain-containing protein [Mesorhizobium sp. LHD-90]
MDVIPSHVSTVPALLRNRDIRVDVALIRVRPTDRSDEYSLGVISDYTEALVACARVVVAEVDPRLPLTRGDAVIPASAIHHFVQAGGDIIQISDPRPTDIEHGVGRRVAELIPDRATVQLGVGGLSCAVARALLGHKELGVHSGVVSDMLVDMVESGAVTNAWKGIDAGVTVTGGLFGTDRLYAWADGNPAITMRSVEYTHDVAVMAKLHAFHSINFAIEVDISGQVNAELAAGRYLGAVGGQVDFVRGARYSKGGRSIIALPATTPNGSVSRIVASLADRPVTTPRSDVDTVVTEYGVADLRGVPFDERRRRLIAIAHPDHRDKLAKADAIAAE